MAYAEKTEFIVPDVSAFNTVRHDAIRDIIDSGCPWTKEDDYIVLRPDTETTIVIAQSHLHDHRIDHFVKFV
jgi:hypothetical protein